MADQLPLFRMDERPPDSYGLDFTGQACRGPNAEHEKCPGYWGDSLRSGKGTRCACLCHEGGEAIETP